MCEFDHLEMEFGAETWRYSTKYEFQTPTVSESRIEVGYTILQIKKMLRKNVAPIEIFKQPEKV